MWLRRARTTQSRNSISAVAFQLKFFTMYRQYDNVVSKLGAMKEYFNKGTNFSWKLIFAIFFGHFAGSDIRESGFTKDFVEIDFCELYKDLAGINFTFVLTNIFSRP